MKRPAFNFKHIIQVRRSHHKLKEVVFKVLDASEPGASQKEITQAYSVFLELEVLDVTPTGNEAWESAKKRYDEKIDLVEVQLTSKLRDRLGAAKGAAEMFRVFAKFKALYAPGRTRPRIRAVIQEYQGALLFQAHRAVLLTRGWSVCINYY